MLLAHKIQLRPSPKQEQFLFQSVGVRRFTYNALLAHFKQDGVKWGKNAANDKLKELKAEYLWMKDVSARTSRNVIDDLDNAFKRFFKNVKQGKKAGFPKFKKKGSGDSFSIREKPKFTVDNRLLRIEKLKTKIKLRQELRLKGIPCQCTVSFRGGFWWVSILVDTTETPWKPIRTRKPSVGIDFGIKTFAVLSDGKEFHSPKPLQKKLKKLAKLNRKFARQKKGSIRREITKRKLSKLHFYVSEQRKATIHELTDYVTRNYDRIVIEDLNVSGMLRNRRLSRAISEIGMSETRRQLEYKSFLRNNELVVADRWFPSTKLCSCCGYKNPLVVLGVSNWICPECDTHHDRDQNAATNLERYSPDTFQRDLNRTKEIGASRSPAVDSVNKPTSNQISIGF